MFTAGFIFSLSVILQRNLYIKTSQLIIFLTLSVLAGKKVRYFVSLIFLIVTVIFNCLVPAGKVIFHILRFPITEDALKSGLAKGLTIITLIYISKFTVGKYLKLPGKLGKILEYSFYYVNELTKGKIKIKMKKPFESVDTLLLEIYEKGPNSKLNNDCKTSIFGGFVVILLLIINLGLLYFKFRGTA